MKSFKIITIGLTALILLGIAGAVIAANYLVYTPIGPISITVPNNGILVLAGSELSCECTLPTDQDCSDAGGAWHVVPDPVTVTWSGPGTFTPQTGTSVTWTAPVATGAATITVTANDSPLANDGARTASITVYVIAVNSVEVHTTDAYNDNGGSGLNDCQVHFGHTSGSGDYAYPNVYLEVQLTAANSSVVDTVTLPVTSESSTTGIKLGFTETGTNTNIYHCDNPLHLDTYSSTSTRRLKVLNEETLSVGGTAGPEVDRGEVATITADVGWWIQDYADAGADAVDYFLDKSEGSDPDPYFWWDGGELRCVTVGSTFSNFVKNVGNTSSSYPADFLFECSHGSSGNIGHFGGSYHIFKPGGGTPTIVSTDWEQDIEWAVFYSCLVFGSDRDTNPAAYIAYWDDALIRTANENNAHGICASCDVLWVAPTEEHMEVFCEMMQGNANTVVDAYMDSAIDNELPMYQENVAALFHDDNEDDYLNDVTPDTTDSQMMYTYYAGDDGYGDYWNPDTLSPLNLRAFTPARSGYDVVCDISTDRPELTKVLVRKANPNPNALKTADFKSPKRDNCGRLQLRKTPRLSGPIHMSRNEAAAAAVSFMAQKGGGMPPDAELARVRTQMVLQYDALDPANTQSQYVKKGLLEYRHKINGIQVAGGNRGDSILVIVAGDEVTGVNHHWREFQKNIGKPQMVISAQDALATAVANIPREIPGAEVTGYSITDIKLFYYGRPSPAPTHTLVPAWSFEVNQSLRVYVDAFTGEFLR